ncbi:MAG: hypothetical protein KJO28_13330 [Desulfofustis sp.]|nr:hypothetical protein [Desulfofustis sp.]
MNFHYIDYMIKERRREELEACARQRILNSAGYSQTGLICKSFRNMVSAVRRVTKQWTLDHRRQYPYGFMVKIVAQTRRENQ